MLINLRKHKAIIAKNAERCREKGIILPTFAQMKDPSLIPDDIKEKLKTLSRAELVKILASDGMFVKRPVLLRNGRFACVGFREEEWKTLLAGDLR